MLSRSLVLIYLLTFGSLTSFYLAASVVPLYAATAGGGGIGAGLTTGAFMFATVAGEFFVPALLRRFGYRVVYCSGLVLLGVPALGLLAFHNLAAILAVCVLRGIGFAIEVVTSGTLVALLVPDERRGEGLGVLGFVAGVPAVVALPIGVWLAGHAGFPVVFFLTAAWALVGLPLVPGLPESQNKPAEVLGMPKGLRTASLLRPMIIFSVSAAAGGALITFLPLALAGAPENLAALALFSQAATMSVGRWWAGRFGDQHGPERLLVPGVLAAGVGILALVAVPNPVAVMAGVLLFGTGFGITQNATAMMMFNRVSKPAYGVVSTMWNLGYDAGWGIGGAGFGLLVAWAGFTSTFGVFGILILATLSLAWFDLKWGHRKTVSQTVR